MFNFNLQIFFTELTRLHIFTLHGIVILQGITEGYDKLQSRESQKEKGQLYNNPLPLKMGPASHHLNLVQSSSSSQPHDPGYGWVKKALDANESIGLDVHKYWFWMVACGGKVWDGSVMVWSSGSSSSNISRPLGALLGPFGTECFFLAPGKMIIFLLGIPCSFMISCFLQRIQHNWVTCVQ